MAFRIIRRYEDGTSREDEDAANDLKAQFLAALSLADKLARGTITERPSPVSIDLYHGTSMLISIKVAPLGVDSD